MFLCLQVFFGSFTDAPDGFSQEMQEITISPGFEYWYNKTVCIKGRLFLSKTLIKAGCTIYTGYRF